MNMEAINTVMPLAPDDMHAGQYITVLAAREHAVPDDDGEGQTHYMRLQIAALGNLKCSEWALGLKGEPLEVLSVDLPFAAVAYMDGSRRFTIDTRDYDLAWISDKYAHALRPPKPSATGWRDDWIVTLIVGTWCGLLLLATLYLLLTY